MESISLKMEEGFLKAIERAMKNNHYTTKTEFIREAIREKMRKLEEQEILNDKEMVAQLKQSKANIKKGLTKEFKY